MFETTKGHLLYPRTLHPCAAVGFVCMVSSERIPTECRWAHGSLPRISPPKLLGNDWICPKLTVLTWHPNKDSQKYKTCSPTNVRVSAVVPPVPHRACPPSLAFAAKWECF